MRSIASRHIQYKNNVHSIRVDKENSDIRLASGLVDSWPKQFWESEGGRTSIWAGVDGAGSSDDSHDRANPRSRPSFSPLASPPSFLSLCIHKYILYMSAVCGYYIAGWHFSPLSFFSVDHAHLAPPSKSYSIP